MRKALWMIALVACSSPKQEDPLVAMAKHPTDAELTRAIPIYRVQHFRAAQAYYRDKLGFKIDWDHGDPADFGAVSRGDMTLFLCEQCQSTAGAWSMSFAKDLEALHTDFTRRGAIVQQPPTDMPWGLREMLVADPDGNIVRFAAAQH